MDPPGEPEEAVTVQLGSVGRQSGSFTVPGAKGPVAFIYMKAENNPTNRSKNRNEVNTNLDLNIFI